MNFKNRMRLGLKGMIVMGVIQCISFMTYAQSDNEDLYSLSLEELMNMEINVASGKNETIRESPGIISYISEEEINNSGARDIMDLLRMVPGFDFGNDVDNSVGLGIRGNWSFEGKVLILLDNQPLNETSYGTFAFGQRIPLDNIKQIEIIRGPGSAMYGGIAGLAVIKITTKKGSELNGASVKAQYGVSNGGALRQNLQASFGKSINKDFGISFSAYTGGGSQSNESYTGQDGTVINYGDSSDIHATNINTTINYKDLNIHFIYDEYETKNLEYDGYLYFNGLYIGADQKIKLNDKFSITPKIQYKKQQPWSYIKSKNIADINDYNAINNRVSADVTAAYEFSEKYHLNAGLAYYNDKSTYFNQGEDYVFENGESSLNFYNIGVFAEANIKTSFANITAGVRLDNHSAVDPALVPRIGITKIIDDFHFKLLYSQAFKTPVMENINLNPDIKPERIEVVEFEMGYKLNSNMFITSNLFYSTIKNVIVYDEAVVDGESVYNYFNFPKSGTHGIELEYKYKGQFGFLNANYSFYRANNNADVEAFKIEDNDALFLGFPAHKITVGGQFKIVKNLYLNPSILYFSNKYWYEYDQDWNLVLQENDNVVLAHINLAYKNLLVSGLDLSAGAYNIFSAKDKFSQPYYGGNKPVLAPGREYNMSLKYSFQL